MCRSEMLLLLVFFGFVHCVLAKPLTLYVSTSGGDQWSGRLPSPARDGKDGPLATLPRALEAAREARANPKAAPDAVTIYLRGGTYQISQPIRIIPADSGESADQPLSIASYRSERPVLSGGRRITGWKPSGDDSRRWQAELPDVREGKWYFRQ